MRRALQVRSLHVHFGPLGGELDHHRVGEHGLAERQGPEPPFHRVHGYGERDPVPERLERHEPHRQSGNTCFRPRSVSASAACRWSSSSPNPKRMWWGRPKCSPGTSSTLCSARTRSTSSGPPIAWRYWTRQMRRVPAERVPEPLEPAFEHRVVGLEDAARAREHLATHRGLECQGGQVIARARRPDGGVVVARPRVARKWGRRHDPADPQPGQAVRLRQAVHHDHALVAAPQRRRGHAVAFGALVHFVREQPGAHLGRAGHDDPAELLGQHVPGGVVGIGDHDELRAGRDRAAHLIGLGLPARRGVQREGPHLGPEVLGEPPGLQVVRQHHGDRVARFDQAPANDEVGLRTASRDEDLLGRGAGVEGGDPAP